MASRAIADFLNNTIFGQSGPVKQFASTLGVTGDRAGACLLESIHCNYIKAISPISDVQASGTPLVKGQYKHSCTSQSECCRSSIRRRSVQAEACNIVTSLMRISDI